MTESTRSSQSFFQRWWWVIAGLIVACSVVLVLAPAASSDPDGLDRVSGDEEFAEKAEDPRYEWLPDYTIPGVDNEWATVVIAGLVGVGLVFGLTFGFGAILRQTRRSSSA
jgi:cobalt/nickel transport protein